MKKCCNKWKSKGKYCKNCPLKIINEADEQKVETKSNSLPDKKDGKKKDIKTNDIKKKNKNKKEKKNKDK